IDDVGRPIEVGNGHATIGASVGLAIGRPGEAPTSVLDAADGALLSAKANGRGCWTVASPRPPR
ncbi:MAG TPA: GGDEF domain-containing protein, partial [Acidimicrobiales bacterium]|nr:GGDEF domain-containing protein [Acidimicrobiales bacterium]